ncbi:uncharacterized protein [Diadema setosum]|uniref:uncharacterized protein n=1 Tax=Diadema setosum TaxID=31175 RepID=UPI003B3B3750
MTSSNPAFIPPSDPDAVSCDAPLTVNCSMPRACKANVVEQTYTHETVGNISFTRRELGCDEGGLQVTYCISGDTFASLVAATVADTLKEIFEPLGLTYRGVSGSLCVCDTGDNCNAISTTTAPPSAGTTVAAPIVRDGSRGGDAGTTMQTTTRGGAMHFTMNGALLFIGTSLSVTAAINIA